jgi:hypothetical protein
MPLKHHPQAFDASAEHAAHDHSESWSLPPMRLGISPPQREFSWLTLNLSRAPEQEFRRDYARKSLSHFRLGIGIAFALWVGFGVLDNWIVPEVKRAVWAIRYAIVAPSWSWPFSSPILDITTA